MNWEDTVMKDRQLLNFELKYSRGDDFYWGAAFDAALKAQAKITWEAAMKEMSLQTIPLADLLSKHRQAGMKEVVEWVEKFGANTVLIDDNGNPVVTYFFDQFALEAFKEEWEIETG